MEFERYDRIRLSWWNPNRIPGVFLGYWITHSGIAALVWDGEGGLSDQVYLTELQEIAHYEESNSTNAAHTNG